MTSKKILLAPLFALALSACDDSTSSSVTNDQAAGLYGTWTGSTSFTYVITQVDLNLDLQLNSDKSLTVGVESTLGSGTATGNWSYANDSLTISTTECPTELATACALLSASPLPVLDLAADSWRTEFPLAGAEKISMPFTRK